MRINNNLMAMNTHRQLGINANNGAKSIEKLSSGYRINRAGDDAAGLAISEKMRAQVRGLNQASRNSQDAISMIQTAEGALNETQAILQRMRELAVQSANDTNVDADRTSIQDEINQLSTEITRISDTTEFNTQKLLDGTLEDIKFQIGANESQDMSLSIGDMRADALDVISETTTIGDAGDAVKSVVAGTDFDIEGATLSATAGGAVAADIDAYASGIDTDGFVSDITVKHATDIINSGSVELVSGVTIENHADFNWTDLADSGSFIQITTDTSGIKVEIDVSGLSGSLVVTDLVQANESGDYIYSDHGVTFELTAEEFATLDTTTNGIRIEFSGSVEASGTDVTVSGRGVNNDFATNGLASGSGSYAGFSGDIEFTTSDTTWNDRAYAIEISGNNLHEASGGALTVTINDESGNAVISDVIDFSGTVSGGSFTYDNNGVKFTIEFESASGFSFAQNLDVGDQAVAVTNSGMDITVTDDNGVERTASVSLASGTYDLDAIATAINDAFNAISGATFSGDVATVTGDSLNLASAFEGADSKVEITDAGGFAAIFDDGDSDTGDDSSANLTLKDADGNTIDTETIKASDTKASFSDADGNVATFTLKASESFDGVDVATEYAATDFERTESGIDVSTQEAASAAISTINDAIESVSTERSKLGAVQNRLEHTIKNLDTSAENLQASESRIRDVDMAKEMMEFTKNNILQQAAQSMLAQANQAPQGVLQLLR